MYTHGCARQTTTSVAAGTGKWERDALLVSAPCRPDVLCASDETMAIRCYNEQSNRVSVGLEFSKCCPACTLSTAHLPNLKVPLFRYDMQPISNMV
jgi:hypothetical protein